MSKVKIPFIVHIMMSYVIFRRHFVKICIPFLCLYTSYAIHLSAYQIPQNNA